MNLKTLAAAINRAGTTDKAKVAAEMARTNVSTPFGQLTFSPSLKTKYQGFKAGNWLHFQYLGDARAGLPDQVRAEAHGVRQVTRSLARTSGF